MIFKKIPLCRLPTLAALIGALSAMAFSLCLVGNTSLLPPPVPILHQGKIISEILSGFAKEALPLVFAALFSRIGRHPWPILLETAGRSFFSLLSMSYLAAHSSNIWTLLAFCLLQTALLLAHIAAATAAISYRKETGLFPFLYFCGLLFFLTVIRLLAMTLIR